MEINYIKEFNIKTKPNIYNKIKRLNYKWEHKFTYTDSHIKLDRPWFYFSFVWLQKVIDLREELVRLGVDNDGSETSNWG